MPRLPLTRKHETYTVDLSPEDVAFVDARVAAIVRRACFDENIVESVARSCYLQGVRDGLQMAASDLEVLAELQQQVRNER